jgi:hypothetical protein
VNIQDAVHVLATGEVDADVMHETRQIAEHSLTRVRAAGRSRDADPRAVEDDVFDGSDRSKMFRIV